MNLSLEFLTHCELVILVWLYIYHCWPEAHTHTHTHTIYDSRILRDISMKLTMIVSFRPFLTQTAFACLFSFLCVKAVHEKRICLFPLRPPFPYVLIKHQCLSTTTNHCLHVKYSHIDSPLSHHRLCSRLNYPGYSIKIPYFLGSKSLPLLLDNNSEKYFSCAFLLSVYFPMFFFLCVYIIY